MGGIGGLLVVVAAVLFFGGIGLFALGVSQDRPLRSMIPVAALGIGLGLLVFILG